MKIKPITIVVIICIVLTIALFTTIILNRVNKVNTSNEADKQVSLSNTDNNNKVTKSQNEKIQDVYDHLMDEDWDYLWNKMIHYDNEIMTIEDLKFYFKSDVKSSDIDEGNVKYGDQGYTISNVDIKNEEDGEMVVGTISNGTYKKVFGIYEKGNSKDNYDLVLEIDYSCRNVSNQSNTLKGLPIVLPSDIENIHLRQLLLDSKFEDVKYFDSYSNENNIDFSKYKAYYAVLPMKSMSIPTDIRNKIKEDGVDIGNPEPISITADCKYGKLYSQEEIETLLESQYGFDSKGIAYTADLYFELDEDRAKILNGLKDVLNGILNTYEETKTFQSDAYKKYFVDDFSDKGYQDVISVFEERIAYPETGLKNLNRRVVGVVAEEDKIQYMGDNIVSFVPGTASIWDAEQGFNNETKTKTCENMNSKEIKLEIQEDGSVKIKEVDLSMFKGLFLMRSDFEWNY